METKGRVLGVDYGDTRTGTALSDPSRFLSSALVCIKGGMRGVAKEIAILVKQHDVTLIVVGLPKNMDGSEGFRAERVRAFCDLLHEETPVEITLYDERLSTVEAHRMMTMTETYGKKRKENIDNLSAQIILQDWLDRERKRHGN
ncbi:MAG: Holliday junction resolvase RuvX [Clostridia bacterium]|nr:Holliday junction resolvase RuvX [Clostridia bacterium]